MIIEESIKVKNYKCFWEEASGFERIMPINIIIGKNNSGKSSLLDLIRFTIDGNREPINSSNSKAEILVGHFLREEEIAVGFGRATRGGPIPGNHFEYGRAFVNSKCIYELENDRKKNFKTLTVEMSPTVNYLMQDCVNAITSPLKGKEFCHVTAERDIVIEADEVQMELKANGVGATSIIQSIINKKAYDSNLIEKKLLNELNKIINPDIEFKRISVQSDDQNKWEIYFLDNNENKIALSKMGSGIKTILLVLLNLIVKPSIKNKSVNEYVFAFEELENNLHPSLQRRLYSYLIDFSKLNNVYFFLTTHSNVVIDAFGAYNNAQLIHVINDGNKSITKTVLGYKENKHILKDLDVRASDLLQSNGIIWVEGPSDRNYLNRWLELLAPDLKEGLHYSIMFYGGRLLANLTFDYGWFNKEIIPLLNINSNAYVIMDRDGKTVSAALNQTKARIEAEIGQKHCWITKGREIENYLSENVIKSWLEKSSIAGNFINFENEKLENNIKQVDKKDKIKYHLNKTSYSNEIVDFINMDSIVILDLKQKLNGLIEIVKEWNSI